jgi:hypothetical protein
VSAGAECFEALLDDAAVFPPGHAALVFSHYVCSPDGVEPAPTALSGSAYLSTSMTSLRIGGS